MILSEKIKNLREETGLSRKAFSEYLGIPLRTVEDWEAGRRNPPEYIPRLISYRIKLDQMQKKRTDRSRNVTIIQDADGHNVVLINDKKFKGQDKSDWKDVEQYLIQYVGECYEIAESSEKIFIDRDFPDEYANSKQRISLKGANRKAKANAAQGIPELIKIASCPSYEENKEEKHSQDAKYGWYRYLVRFALPVYDDQTNELIRYNIFHAKMLVRHAEDCNKYLYDFLAIKKENEQPV